MQTHMQRKHYHRHSFRSLAKKITSNHLQKNHLDLHVQTTVHKKTLLLFYNDIAKCEPILINKSKIRNVAQRWRAAVSDVAAVQFNLNEESWRLERKVILQFKLLCWGFRMCSKSAISFFAVRRKSAILLPQRRATLRAPS